MNTAEKLARSMVLQKFEYQIIGNLGQDDAMIKLKNSKKVVVEPIWTVTGDIEGNKYAEYISKHPEYDGVYIRSGLVKRIESAGNSLPDNFRLVIRAGHRPIEVQKSDLLEVAQNYKNKNPDVDDQEALKHARLFVSDPEIEQPAHCCGAAIDVDVYDTNTGQYVDFGSKVNQDSEISYLYYDRLSPAQKQNRSMLLKAMLGAGFASNYEEWWHYSYGDKVWAWFYDKSNCLYDLIEI